MKSFGPPSNNPKGRDYTTALRGRILTDHIIDNYTRQGYYGESRRTALLAVAQQQKRRAPKFDALKEALRLLA